MGHLVRTLPTFLLLWGNLLDGSALRGYPETWLGKKADLLDS